MLAEKRIAFVFISILLLITGCSNKEDGKAEKLALIKQTNPKPMDIIYGMDGDDYRTDNPDEGLITDVKKMAAKHESIYDVIVVKNGKDILVAYKVKHLKRFQMKKIEKDLDKQLNKKYPDYHFMVSSDYKVFLEAMRLNKMLKDHDVPDDKAKKKFKEIINLKNEIT